jgi:hypothetical protein
MFIVTRLLVSTTTVDLLAALGIKRDAPPPPPPPPQQFQQNNNASPISKFAFHATPTAGANKRRTSVLSAEDSNDASSNGRSGNGGNAGALPRASPGQQASMIPARVMLRGGATGSGNTGSNSTALKAEDVFAQQAAASADSQRQSALLMHMLKIQQAPSGQQR